MSADYRCRRASRDDAAGLLELFESAGTGCYCNYWHFEGDKNAWLEQCYLKPELNRAALVERLAGPDLAGIVAIDGAGTCCGWLKLMRAAAAPRLYQQRVYRNLPCFNAGSRDDVYAVGCCYILETERGRGLARALLTAAIAEARAVGASALEAFPRGKSGSGGRDTGDTGDNKTETETETETKTETERLRPDEVWMGPEALFLQAGFKKVSDFRPYPVLRLHLR
jgi:GNAT superfamily N-acetyltransferase